MFTLMFVLGVYSDLFANCLLFIVCLVFDVVYVIVC